MTYFWKIAKLQRVKRNLWFHFILALVAEDPVVPVVELIRQNEVEPNFIIGINGTLYFSA